MILLILFAFFAGIVTILSPCILPVLPIVLSASAGLEGKQKPWGVVTGFVASFTFFTLFLSLIVKASGIPADSFRYISIVILIIFGISMIVPGFQMIVERMFGRLTALVPRSGERHGFGGGIVIGLSLGLLWTPCVGPILASVISLALTGTVTFQTFLITLSYAIGTAVPMFLVIQAGSNALQKVPWLVKNTGKIQSFFGVVMILVAVAIYFNLDRSFQTYILSRFPAYGTGLTNFENNTKINTQLSQLRTGVSEAVGSEGLAPEIIPGGEWFNSKPLKLSELRGKVVLIDFWTYTCINCQRTLPYVENWWEKYKDKGLVVIGVHTPEFEFEKEPANVKKAIADFKLTYPVVQDNNYATWNAYSNQYWPAKYFIDKNGYIRDTHFGEGDYDKSEKIIQDLLAETGETGVNLPINNPTYQVDAFTPETYLGYGRISGFASPERIVRDKLSDYTFPARLPSDRMAYSGKWTINQEYASPTAGSKLEFDFSAKEVYLVMRPRSAPAKVKVMVDGKIQYTGADAPGGMVTVDADRLYKLVNLPTAERHVLMLEFMDDNVDLYAFTFG